MLAPYAASKVFLASFNAALAEEVKGKGIDIETLNTYFVVSNMSKIRRATITTPMPKPYVKSVLAKVRLVVRFISPFSDLRADWPAVWCSLDWAPHGF